MKKVGISASNIKHGRFTLSRLSGYNVDAVRGVGAIPIIIPSLSNAELADSYIDEIDALIITGGNDVSPFLYGEDPNTEEVYDFERDEFELRLFNKAMEKQIPILCICRGLQLANVARGGRNIRDLKKAGYNEIIHAVKNVNWNESTDAYHQIKLSKNSKFYCFAGEDTLVINSIHHQAIETLGENMVAVARANDGVIEAVEMKDYDKFIGFQFHPERLQHMDAFKKVYLDLVGRA